MSILTRFFGRTASEGAAFALGTAVGPALGPAVRELVNEANSTYPTRPIDAGTLANGVSQGQIDPAWAADEAKNTGVNGSRFNRLVAIANTGPGVPTAFDLWRRGVIDEAGFRRAAKRQGIEPEWIDDLVQTKDELLTPGELSAAIHRGLVKDPGLLKGEQPAPPYKVEAYPVYPIDAIDEAAGSGYDRDRLGVLVGLQGLPMGPHEAAQALFRGIITHGDYIRAFNESNNRNEWAQAVLDQSRQIPTARDFFENALRGYHDFQWALDQAKRHGMSTADATVIYQNQGRPMNIRQITQALSRGGKFQPEPGELTDPYEASVVEGNIKPAYYDLAKALKYTLPSPFVMRQLTQSGVWSESKCAKRLKDSGWIPADADEAAAAWAAPATSSSSSYGDKAKAQLWARTHSSYLASEINKTDARSAFAAIGVPTAERDDVLATWDRERALIRKQLTPAQIKKAWAEPVRNPATGAPWTRDEAIARLIDLGYSPADANTFLGL